MGVRSRYETQIPRLYYNRLKEKNVESRFKRSSYWCNTPITSYSKHIQKKNLQSNTSMKRVFQTHISFVRETKFFN